MLFKKIIIFSDDFEYFSGTLEFGFINLGYSNRSILNDCEIDRSLINESVSLKKGDPILFIIDPDYEQSKKQECETNLDKAIKVLRKIKTKFYLLRAKSIHKQPADFKPHYNAKVLREINRLRKTFINLNIEPCF